MRIARCRELPCGNLGVASRVVELLRVELIEDEEFGLVAVGLHNHAAHPDSERKYAVAGEFRQEGELQRVGASRIAELREVPGELESNARTIRHLDA